MPEWHSSRPEAVETGTNSGARKPPRTATRPPRAIPLGPRSRHSRGSGRRMSCPCHSEHELPRHRHTDPRKPRLGGMRRSEKLRLPVTATPRGPASKWKYSSSSDRCRRNLRPGSDAHPATAVPPGSIVQARPGGTTRRRVVIGAVGPRRSGRWRSIGPSSRVRPANARRRCVRLAARVARAAKPIPIVVDPIDAASSSRLELFSRGSRVGEVRGPGLPPASGSSLAGG